MAKTKRYYQKKIETLQFQIPTFFSAGQLFGARVEDTTKVKKVLFRQGNRTIDRTCEDPKQEAKNFADSINQNHKRPAIVRLTFAGNGPHAYVVVDNNNHQQVAWRETQKQARRIKEKQRQGKN